MQWFDMKLSTVPGVFRKRLPISLVHREQIIRQSTELVCRAYSEVHAAVTNPANEYKDPESIVRRPPQQVRTLLSWLRRSSASAECRVPGTLQVAEVFSLLIFTLKFDGYSFLCVIRAEVPVIALFRSQWHGSNVSTGVSVALYLLATCQPCSPVCPGMSV